MNPNKNLKVFLKPYSPDIQKLALELRGFIVETIPEANELIWNNYNAMAIAYSKSKVLKDAFCHIAVYSKHVNFGFNRGVELLNPQVPLEGKGKLIRHIKVTDINSFPKKEITKMIFEAVAISDSRNADLLLKDTEGESVVMAISENKIRPK